MNQFGSAKEYWLAVKQGIDNVKADAARQELQGHDFVYIINVNPRTVLPGQISEATYEMASQRIHADGSHRLATDVEIRAYQNLCKSREQTLANMEKARRSQLKIEVKGNA